MATNSISTTKGLQDPPWDTELLAKELDLSLTPDPSPAPGPQPGPRYVTSARWGGESGLTCPQVPHRGSTVGI